MAHHNSQQIRDQILSAIRQLVFRSDQDDSGADYAESFVRVVDFEKLASRNTDILYGRNGTGKTHLLRAFEQFCFDDFVHAKALPVYIDCRQLDVQTLGSEISIERLLSVFYKRLIRKILTDLVEFTERTLTVDFLDRLFQSEGAVRRSKIDKSLAALKELLDEGSIDESLHSYVRKIERERDGSSKLSFGAEASLGGDAGGATGEAKAEGTVGRSVAWKDKRNLETIYDGLAIIDYEQIRTHIVTIIENSGADSAVILIDEWSDLPRALQPLIAEMIRKTLGTQGPIALKIAALRFFCWPRATVEGRQPIGLTGANLNVVADLDALFRFEAQGQAVKDFLTAVLYKHVVAIKPELGELTLWEFEKELCSKVFDGASPYQEIVRASEGNPRDFLRMIASSFKSDEFETGKKIGERQVLATAIDYFLNSKQPDIEHDSDLKSTFDDLFSLVATCKSKLFVVSSAVGEHNAKLRELWHYRFVHLVQQRVPVIINGIPKQYDLYSMDYGKLLSLKLSAEGRKWFETITTVSEVMGRMLDIFAGLPFSIPIESILETEGAKGKMQKFLGRTAVLQAGLEHGSAEAIEQLIDKGCIADDALSATN